MGDYLNASSEFTLAVRSAVKILRWFGDYPAAVLALERVQKMLLEGKSYELVYPATLHWSSIVNCLECFSKVGYLLTARSLLCDGYISCSAECSRACLLA